MKAKKIEEISVILRRFKTEEYPFYIMANPFANRWKPLIFAEILREFPAILWADASVIFLNGTVLEPVRKKICQGDLFPAVRFSAASRSVLATTNPLMYSYCFASNYSNSSEKKFSQ